MYHFLSFFATFGSNFSSFIVNSVSTSFTPPFTCLNVNLPWTSKSSFKFLPFYIFVTSFWHTCTSYLNFVSKLFKITFLTNKFCFICNTFIFPSTEVLCHLFHKTVLILLQEAKFLCCLYRNKYSNLLHIFEANILLLLEKF